MLAPPARQMHYAVVFFLEMIMKFKHLFFGLVTGTLLLLATGCGKQESPVATASDNASKNPAPAAGEKQQTLQEPNRAGNQSAPKARQETIVANNPAPTSDAATRASVPVLSDSASSPPTTQVQATPSNPSANPTAASPAEATGTPGTTVSNVLQSQQQALAQAATNQFQTMTAAATNQIQAMAVAATNKALAASGMTNQTAASATNTVQALLDQAKTLTANQKYQDALGYVAQLYNTKLTPDQKQQVDSLKAQIQSAMAQKAESEATSALGGLLGGKK
jgi:hypothetical protein